MCKYTQSFVCIFIYQLNTFQTLHSIKSVMIWYCEELSKLITLPSSLVICTFEIQTIIRLLFIMTVSENYTLFNVLDKLEPQSEQLRIDPSQVQYPVIAQETAR